MVLALSPWFAHAGAAVVMHKSPEIINNPTSQGSDLVLKAPINSAPFSITSTSTVLIADNALVPDGNNGTTFVDAGQSGTGQISVYTVRSGDTLSTIANMFGVSTNTIIWANELRGSHISIGQELVILPISGIQHTVAKGDTLKSIAKKYSTDLGDILSYNGLTEDSSLTLGQVIIVPDGEPSASTSSDSTPTKTSHSSTKGSSDYTNSCSLKVSTYERLLVNPCSYPSYDDYYIRPIDGGRKTQNLHGYNAVDLAASVGTSIHAAASGKVIISRTGGYNGGYGTYVVISHPNGTQTLYGHMSQNIVKVGQYVEQGEKIGEIGMTGKTTGPHVHFEIRGARNPF